MITAPERRKRRSRYRQPVVPPWLTPRRAAIGAGLAIAVLVLTFVFRILLSLGHFTGKNPIAALGDLIGGGHGSAVAAQIQGQNRINIAFYGYGGTGHDGAYLTDSIMVVSIQPRPGGQPPQVAEISVPRDWYVPMDIGGGLIHSGRINEAYSIGQSDTPVRSTAYGGPHGGADLADHVIGSLLGIHIDHYVAVDFTAFKTAVDAVGGVDVTVQRSFTDTQYPHGECDQGDCAVETVHFDAGPQHLDGARALIFTRSRHGDNGEGTDFARSKRQQLVVAALKQKVVSVDGLTHLPDILDALAGHVSTDLDLGEMTALYGLVKGVDTAAVEHVSIDWTNFVYACNVPQCAADYLLSYDRTGASLQHYVQNLIPDSKPLAEHVPISVEDGSGAGGGASARWNGLLGSLGFSATDHGSTAATATTRVIDESGGSGTATAQWLASYFGVEVTQTPPAAVQPVASPSPSASPAPGVVLILGADEERAFHGLAPPAASPGAPVDGSTAQVTPSLAPTPPPADTPAPAPSAANQATPAAPPPPATTPAPPPPPPAPTPAPTPTPLCLIVCL